MPSKRAFLTAFSSRPKNTGLPASASQNEIENGCFVSRFLVVLIAGRASCLGTGGSQKRNAGALGVFSVSTAANRLLGFSFLLLGCRSVCNGREGKNFDARLAGGPWGANQVASVL